MIHTVNNPKLVKYFDFFEEKETFTGVAKDKRNTIAYYLNGKYHRTDGPAIEDTNGNKAWYLNGKRHREDGPAVEYPNRCKEWYLNGEYYGFNYDYTNESWIRFTKLLLLK